MNAWIPALQATALSLSLLWLLVALASRPHSPLATVWAVFCGSIAMMMARGLVGPDAVGWYQLFGVGACLTCNGFWLVSRALFRPGRPFGAPHLAYAGLVAALIILVQQRAWLPPALAVTAGELLKMLSSAALVMAFWEGLRGWHLHHGVERALRVVFLATYGGCVAACLVAPALFDPAGTGGVQTASAAAAAAAILLATQGLVAWRLRHPLAAPDPAQAATPACTGTDRAAYLDETTAPTQKNPADAAALAALRDEDIALARALERHMRTQRPWLQPELKLTQLAHALQVGEYRISRAIHGPLGHRNISQYVNGYRLDHARTLLRDPACDAWSTLVVGMESGFGSLGAFHRAFRAVEGVTPGEYRAARDIAAAQPSPG
jgi:AraC-like DNA-binding protein